MRDHVLGRDDPSRYAGIAQEEKVLDWLHDCYFAAVSGDAPAFEAWPSHEGMTQTLTTLLISADDCAQRLLLARVHPRSLGHASWRNVGSGEACPDMSCEEQMVLLLHQRARKLPFRYVSTAQLH